MRQLLQTLLLIGFSAAAVAGDQYDARQWLERMASAMNQMSYQGTFVYIRGINVETMRITHVVDDDGIRERLYSINGPQREILRDKDGVRCVMGDDKAIMSDPIVNGAIFPDIPLESLEQENAKYSFETGGLARVAGHRALKVSIRPVDTFRYGYEFWLEEHTGLLLKWMLYDSKNKILARMMFTDLKLGSDIREEELDSPTPSEEFVKLTTSMPDRKSLKRSVPEWKPASLPPGFKLAAHSMQEKGGKSVFEHQVYSDGLASVSVYVEDLDSESKPAQGARKIGTANVFSRQVGPKQVTVIGEVPAMTVRSIGNAVAAPANHR